MQERARRTAPATEAEARVRPEDWILAVLLALLPLLGPGMGRGNGLSLAGVGILVWVGHRAPVSRAVGDAHRALGISVVLALLCLLLPPAGGSRPLASTLVPLVRLGLVTVLALALLRGIGRPRPWMRTADLAALAAVLGAGALALALPPRLGGGAAAPLVFSLGLVYGVHRIHLLRSRALPLLARSTLFGVSGAVLGAFWSAIPC